MYLNIYKNFFTLLNHNIWFTFIETLKAKNTISDVDIKRLVRQMRTQRHPWMVEGLKQYELVYDIVIHLVQEMIEFSSL